VPFGFKIQIRLLCRAGNSCCFGEHKIANLLAARLQEMLLQTDEFFIYAYNIT
jgi:hypothetical protein